MELTKLISLPFGRRINLHVVTYNGRRKPSGRSPAASNASACTCGEQQWRGKFRSEVWQSHWPPCPLSPKPERVR